MNLTKFISTFTTVALVLAVVFVQAPKAEALSTRIAPANTYNKEVTGVSSASSTAIDINSATNFAGESAFYNRLLTLLFNCTPVSTTTDSIINVGQTNLAWYWITGQDASSSVAFYDALQVTGTPAVAEWNIPASTTITWLPQRIIGANFTKGLYMDVTLGGMGRINLCYNNAS